jgi:hypothetical protein
VVRWSGDHCATYRLQHECKEVDVRRQPMKGSVFLAKAYGVGWQDTQRPTQRERYGRGASRRSIAAGR